MTSALTSVPRRSTWPGTALAIGTSFVLIPTLTWAAMTEDRAVRPTSTAADAAGYRQRLWLVGPTLYVQKLLTARRLAR
jgi:hypothetical protein